MQRATVVLWMLLTLFNIQCCCCSHRQAAGLCLSTSVLHIHLRELRTANQKISSYFQRRDGNIRVSLLRGKFQHEFKGRLGCQFLKEMLDFYLSHIIPAAKTQSKAYNTHISKIGNTLFELQQNIENCHQLFNCDTCNCNRSNYIEEIYNMYKKLQDKGIYKAMGELNTFIDWLDRFLSMKLKGANKKRK
ncbi:interleukin-10 [Callorhinchus milii]|uniref:Interleukin family protein n=2 Tax=Callorhinchus milii TaxID=7868 RepID=A0A4W3GN43_CALMI|nr:interleukin-10 [Callorhinchus milii]|eukprot:gi/632963185/ref/XP_007897740.1/ PREDICTED: interleukin-10 [Callorhinchus milii]